MTTLRTLFPLFLFFLLQAAFPGIAAAEPAGRKAHHDAFRAGNYRDAFDGFKELLTSQSGYEGMDDDLVTAISCLNNLSRLNEFDTFLEEVISKHPASSKLQAAAARQYLGSMHYGFVVAGKFERGYSRGGQARYVSTMERDRVRGLQLFLQAIKLSRDSTGADKNYELAALYAELALALRSNQPGWKLQALTDLSKLPDYDDGYGYSDRSQSGAPVDSNGNPVLYLIPESFESAKSDGERYRFAMAETSRLNPSRSDEMQVNWAEFLLSQFGTQTMAGSRLFGDGDDDEEEAKSGGTYVLHMLSDEETIARLASGIKRFNLADEYNPIKIFRTIKSGPYQTRALRELAGIYQNRRQFPRAAEYWKAAYEISRDSSDRGALDQIVGAWGRFEPTMSQPAGSEAVLEFIFRNGENAAFEAHEVKLEKLIEDTIAYLKSNPSETDWNKVNLSNIGYRLIVHDQTQYVGEKVASWHEKLTPRESHFDRRVTIKTPLKQAGMYLVTATMAGGNTSRLLITINDSAIVRKPLTAANYYFVADAVSGKPLANRKVSFFGYRHEYHSNLLGGRSHEIKTKELTLTSNARGEITANAAQLESAYQWLMYTRGESGKVSMLDFSHYWFPQYYDHAYNQRKAYVITDRPVYRPEQAVKFKVWVRNARYDMDNDERERGASYRVIVHNPRSEKIYDKNLTADEFGGFDGQLELPKGAALGQYRVEIQHVGGSSFRVEEYKKPEFEVKVEAPADPVALGESFKAKVSAKYYFGAPVTSAKVKIKIQRHEHTASWFPWGVWDWLYGRGYWWFGYDYTWLPRWHEWGCIRPIPFWWNSPRNPPELISESESEIGKDGTLELPIDTSLAKEIHGNKDHRYEISVEVTDQSRRTIYSKGEVLVARKPFKVYAWVDRGYYQSGDTISANFKAQRLDGKPVSGKGTLRLLSISYKDGADAPGENEVQRWELGTDAQGESEIQIKAAQAGQYRLSYEVTDAKARAIEGGYLFTVYGDAFNSEAFRFNNIEIIPDKREYAAGEKAKLLINTNKANSTVLLFLRPSNGIYLAPQQIALKGKSQVVTVDISKKDMPNIFVEAVTIADGRVYSELRELYIPPEQRALNVEVTPSKTEYKPDEEVELAVKISDLAGKPYAGSTVVSVYDRSVDYISGGSNIPEIKEFFWKWRRTHNMNTASNLDDYAGPIYLPAEALMRAIGVFGNTVADEEQRRRQPASRSVSGAKRKGDFAEQSEAFMDVTLAGVAEAAPAPQEMESDMKLARKDANVAGAAGGAAGDDSEPVEPTVRKEFADTAYWAASVTTAADGSAKIKFKAPQNLTAWKARVWGLGHGTRVGEAETEITTAKQLLVRLQAPRFFVEKDEVVISANIHNYLNSQKNVKAKIEIPGQSLELIDSGTKDVTVDSHGELRVDWRVKVVREGEAVIRVSALTDEESDAMEMRFPVFVHGMLKTESWSGAIRPEQETGKLEFNIPAERRPEQSLLEVRYSPTLAGAMVDALPYLADYPYGCTEQTLSRFLPTVITQKVLKEMKLDLAAIHEKRTNLNAQEIGDDRSRAAQWKRLERNPVFDEAEVNRMGRAGLERLLSMQLSDGGWGWFSGTGEHSSAHTTAHVMHGLQIARSLGMEVPSASFERGADWLENFQAGEIQKIRNHPSQTNPYKQYADNMDAFTLMILNEADRPSKEMAEFLYRDRNQLAVYGKAAFGLAMHKVGDQEKLTMLLKNISQYVVQDDENQTAYLKLGNDAYWWYWYGSEYEAHAYYLKLLAKAEPKSDVAPRLVKYLLNNRKNATYWNSTRDTATIIEAFADYLKASGELAPDMTVEILVDGKKIKEVKLTPQNLFTFDNKFVLQGSELSTGKHTLELRKKGQGPLYFNAYLTNFTLEDFITRAGLEIKVNRKYYKLIDADQTGIAQGSHGQVVQEKRDKYVREELPSLSEVKSGDLVEIELEIESKNDYEYIIFEDMKAAGFEPLEVRSGYNGNEMGAYVEFRDEKTAFFLRTLARGRHSVSYRMKAEIPGKFSALPTKAYAMYAPELKANSDEIKLSVHD